MLMKRIYEGGMTTTSGGNLSVRDANGDIWITPGSIDKGSLTRRDILCVKPDGTVIGPHNPSVELPFHKKVYETRPDAGAVLHAHPPGLVAFSIVGCIPDTRILPNAYNVCGQVGFAPYDIPGSPALGNKIAEKLRGGSNIVVLENHGAVALGDDLFQAFMRFETLEYCARLQINALRLGNCVSLTPEELSISEWKSDVCMESFHPGGHTSLEKEGRREMCELIHRAYDRQLFTSTQGTFSMRLPDDSFLITPHGLDRKYLEPGDIVLVKDGRCEQGKTPSRSVLLHRDIYRAHNGINAVIIANPPHIMAYGVAGARFDSRTIPESYIMLRDVSVLPFGINIAMHDKIIQTVSASAPLVMTQNDSLLVTGPSLLKVYDSLEVAEFSARALLAAAALGAVKPIGQKEIDDIKAAFSLE